MPARALAAAVPDALPLVEADAGRVVQVLANLLTNAVKFTPSGGRVTVDTLTRPELPAAVFVRVHDTGVGIPDDKLESVFEPFVQVDSSHARRMEGTGLGLAISRDLARGMGGDLVAESTPEVGSTFTLTLPAA